MIFRQFWAVLEKFIFHPRKCQNTWKNFELHIDPMVHVKHRNRDADIIWCSRHTGCLCSAADMIHGVADTKCDAAEYDAWCGWHDARVGNVGQAWGVSPTLLCGKNKFLLNEYQGIFMLIKNIFLFFLIWKMDFFRPTHPQNLENYRFFFLEPFP